MDKKRVRLWTRKECGYGHVRKGCGYGQVKGVSMGCGYGQEKGVAMDEKVEGIASGLIVRVIDRTLSGQFLYL